MRKVRLGVLIVLALIIATTTTGCYSKPASGEIGVVRNGGPFDNHQIRQIIENGAGNTWVGVSSETHYYPVHTQQRTFSVKSCGRNDDGTPKKCKEADASAITVPTSDGVEVTISGTTYLNTVFGDPTVDKSSVKCSKEQGGGTGDCLLRQFDTQFGTREFGGEHVWDGPDGYKKFLAAIVEPVIVNNMRETVGSFTCAQLVSSCALVQNTGNTNVAKVTRQANKNNNQSNITQIQDSINSGLILDLKTSLGEEYFNNVRFTISTVELPGKVQEAVNTAQSSFAQVSQAQAKVKTADLESQANQRRQRGYNACPACARIDAIKALPRNLTALGSGIAIGVK